MRIHIHIVAAVLLACFGIQSSGQQRPELAGSKQAPGLQETDASACQAEVARLRKLTAEQRTYIELLEQKVQSLEQKPAPEKGKTP